MDAGLVLGRLDFIQPGKDENRSLFKYVLDTADIFFRARVA